MSCDVVHNILNATEWALEDMNKWKLYSFCIRLMGLDAGGSTFLQPRCPGGPNDKCQRPPVMSTKAESGMRVELVPEKAASDFTFHKSATGISVIYPESRSDPTSPDALAHYLATLLTSVFVEEEISIARKIANSGSTKTLDEAWLQSISPDLLSQVEQRETRSLGYASTYHLTFSLFTAGPSPSSWEVGTALQEHIRPWLSALSLVSHFDITTQVQLYSASSSSVQPFTKEHNNGSFLSRNDLTAFVNAAEWPLSPSIGPGPTINFVLYVPLPAQVPLKIDGDGGDSWLIPQWGGIKIVNPQLQSHPETGALSIPDHLSDASLAPAFETFTFQLSSLLGVPTLRHENKSLPLQARLQSHLRLSTLSTYLGASSTLASLARLSQSLSNIPIPREVAKLVHDTIAHLDTSCERVRQGNWADALVHAREAHEKSERAFFDKSMVGQVYFPDEHKIAVYLPLLGPIGVPLVVALVKEIRRSTLSFRSRKP